MTPDLQKTRLHVWHVGQKATMADFAGFHMPLWYSSVREEHLAVLQKAGMFDTSHMNGLTVTGPDARRLLQWCFSNDLERCTQGKKHPLTDGRCVYGAFLQAAGGVIDDAIIMQSDSQTYQVVVNAGMGAVIAEHLQEQGTECAVQIIDQSRQVAKMDLQGPASPLVLQKVLANPATVFADLPYFTFKGHWNPADPSSAAVRLQDGTPLLLSRTGYTGELGFELFVIPDNLVKLWTTLLEAGAEYGVRPCGLAARDSLRVGAVLPLARQDIGDWPFINHPWTLALPFTPAGAGFSKSFLGDQALLQVSRPEYTYPFAGDDLRKVSLPARVLNLSGSAIGTVLSCVTDMAIARHAGRIVSINSPDKPPELSIKGLGCGFVKTSVQLNAGDAVMLQDQRRRIQVRIEKDIRPCRSARQPVVLSNLFNTH